MAARDTKPKGAKPDKLMRDALMLALNREAEDADGRPTKKLHMIAEALVDKAAAGDVGAATFVADRVDGKPHQTAEITHIRTRASELSDDELAGIVGAGSSERTSPQAVDPSQLN